MLINKSNLIKTASACLKNKLFLLLLIILLALVLRMINLGQEPYWGDEVLSLDIVNHYQDDLAGMIYYIQEIEVHPPLYYIILFYWTKLFGYGELGARLLSLLFGLGVIILSYHLVKKIFNGERMALLTAFLLAVLPIQIEFSQEARPYIIYCFFGLLSTLGLWQYLKTRRISYFILYILSSLIGLYLHYSFFFIIGATASFWFLDIFVLRQKNIAKNFIKWLSAHFLIFLGFYWQLKFFLYKIVLADYTIFDIPRTASSNIRSVNFFEVIINKIIWLAKKQTADRIEIIAVFLFKLAFFSCLFYIIVKHKNSIKDFLKRRGRDILLIIWLFTAPILLFLFSPQSLAYVDICERHIISSSVFIIILLVLVLDYLDFRKRMLLLLLFLISIMNFAIIVIQDDSVWDLQHRMGIVSEFISDKYEGGDIVMVPYAFSRTDTNYYFPNRISILTVFPTPLLNPEDDLLSSRQTLGFIENESHFRMETLMDNSAYLQNRIKFKMDYIIRKYQPKRIWLILFLNDGRMARWMLKNGWRQEIWTIHPQLMPVELYVREDGEFK